MPVPAISIGDFISVRGRRWLVQDVTARDRQQRVALACIEDDAQGERLDVIWEPEIAPESSTRTLGPRWDGDGTDDLSVFGAYLRTIRY